MKKKYISLVFSIFAIICQVMVGAVGAGNVSALDTDNFYFDDFTADYYLSQDEEGISHLKVIENFTTIFPDYNQNKGICREIPFTNYGGVNVTLPALTRYNMKLLRNGLSEPIYSIEKYSDYYEVCTGDDDYVKGKQVYTFEYEFEKVVTDFGDYQELYWDTNGNGWTQKFNSVTAKLHFVGDDVKSSFTGDSWCYVGSYGEKGSERCKITKTSDGVEFTANNLRKYENLTFDVELKPGAFAVPEPEKSYIFIYLLLIVAVVAALMLISPIKKYVESRKLANFYKGLFETPEYQPHPKYSLTELTELYFGRKKDSKVGILLDLVIRGKVKIVKGESGLLGGHKWQVEVVNLDDVDKEGLIVLAILKGGDDPSVGDSITVRRRSSDSTLIRLRKKFENTVLANLKSHGLVDSKYKIGGRESISTSIAVWIVCFITFGWVALPIIFVFMEFVTSGNGIVGKVPVGREVAVPAMIVIIITTIIVRSILKRSAKKYVGYTEDGLRAARYMDGLKLYIEMAEADRIKFLQSVENADTSPDGVVHLYEKLLPYAAVLGLEKSWMGELEKYYKIEGVESSGWYNSGVSVTDVVYVSTLASRYMNYSTTVQSSGGGISGGGGSSSGFSGGGGGGFSGGGGGGGGGHGR